MRASRNNIHKHIQSMKTHWRASCTKKSLSVPVVSASASPITWKNCMRVRALRANKLVRTKSKNRKWRIKHRTPFFHSVTQLLAKEYLRVHHAVKHRSHFPFVVAASSRRPHGQRHVPPLYFFPLLVQLLLQVRLRQLPCRAQVQKHFVGPGLVRIFTTAIDLATAAAGTTSAASVVANGRIQQTSVVPHAQCFHHKTGSGGNVHPRHVLFLDFSVEGHFFLAGELEPLLGNLCEWMQ